MKLQAEQKVFIGSCVALAVLAALIIAAFYANRLNREKDRWVRHTYEVSRNVVHVRSLAKDVELAHHGFMSTGESRYWDAMILVKEKFPAAMARLRNLVEDNPEQLEAARHYEEAISRRMEALKSSAEQRSLQMKEFRSTEYWNLSQLEMDKIRLLAREMMDREDVLLEHRVEEAEDASRQVQLYAGLLLLMGVGVAILLYWQIYLMVLRRRETEALRKSESRFHTIADTVPSILWQLDPTGRPLFINRTWYEYTGSASNEYNDDSGKRYIHPDDWHAITKGLADALRDKVPWTGQFRIRQRNGSYGWFLGQGVPLHAKNGEMECFIGQSMNVTDLHQATEALSAEKQRLAVTLHSIGDGVVTTDVEGRVVLLNHEGEYLTGWSQSEAAGKPLSEVFHIVHEYTRLTLEDPVQKVLRTGKTVELANHTILVSRDGRERVIADSAAPIRDSNGQTIGTVLVFRDSTQKERLAEEMLRSSKLDSLGVLAGGIAHDFNNLLATVLGNISILERFPDDRVNGATCLNEARQACQRAKDLTQQLLTFAKGGVPVRKLAGLKEVIMESTRFAVHGSSAQLMLDIAPELDPVLMDVGQISQVLHNITLNAVHAMPAGGVIRVKANNVPDHPSGKMVHISIADTGIGIKPEHLARVFDPYFTTKTSGNGLGLASAYSIIKKHEGEITVESVLGQGSTFHVFLPAHDARLEKQEEAAAGEDLEHGAGKLLVLEDDQTLARMVKLMLGNLGYEVITVSTGNQAIDVYREAMTSRHPFAGCLIDLTLTGSINGAETFSHLKQMDPAVRALVCSGYSNDQVIANFQTHGFCGVVPKPYSIEDISRAVKMMLGKDKSKPL